MRNDRPFIFTRRWAREGFTLVELLSVVAVIGLLTALLIPALGQARVSAQKSQCASNLRQIGIGLALFAQDHNGAFPFSTHTVQAEDSWIYTLAPYVGDVDELRICPADPLGEARLQAGLTSYVLNEFVVVPNRDPLGRMRADDYTNHMKLHQPARTMVAFIASERMALGGHSDHTHSRGWNSWARVTADIQPDRFGAGSLSGTANYLFADGHVENIEAQTLHDKIVAGINPADPSQL